MTEKVLIVDDDRTVTNILERYLNYEGYQVASTYDGQEALRLAHEWGPDLIILDLKLPVIDGLEVCQRLRLHNQLPIIMLTSRVEETDRVIGLEMGADDYIVKPFSPRELVARVKAVLRRTNASSERAPTGTLRFDGITINPNARIVTVDGVEVHLTAKEFDLLHLLASNYGQVFTRAQIMDQVWDYHYAGATSTITVHIRRLRDKIETTSMRPRYIKTVWGLGYKFER